LKIIFFFISKFNHQRFGKENCKSFVPDKKSVGYFFRRIAQFPQNWYERKVRRIWNNEAQYQKRKRRI